MRKDQRNQRYPAGGMQSLSKNQNRQKFSRKMQRNYGRGQWHDRKPVVSIAIILKDGFISNSFFYSLLKKTL